MLLYRTIWRFGQPNTPPHPRRLDLSYTVASDNLTNLPWNATQLTYLNVSGVVVNGALPPNVTRLQLLDTIGLQNCSLTGSVLAQLANIPRLRYGRVVRSGVSKKWLHPLVLRPLLTDRWKPTCNRVSCVCVCVCVCRVIDVSLNARIDATLPAALASLPQLVHLDLRYSSVQLSDTVSLLTSLTYVPARRRLLSLLPRCLLREVALM